MSCLFLPDFFTTDDVDSSIIFSLYFLKLVARIQRELVVRQTLVSPETTFEAEKV